MRTRSSAAADKAGNDTDVEEEAPLVAKKRRGASRAQVPGRGGRSGRRGRGKGSAAPVSLDESEPYDELHRSKPTRKRLAAAAAASPDGGEADDEPQRSKLASAADGEEAEEGEEGTAKAAGALLEAPWEEEGEEEEEEEGDGEEDEEDKWAEEGE